MDEEIERIRAMSDDERVNYLNSITNKEKFPIVYVKEILKGLQSPNLKLMYSSLLGSYGDLSDLFESIESEYDDEKLSFIKSEVENGERTIKNVIRIFLLAKSIKIDSKKMLAIKTFKDFNYEVMKGMDANPDFYISQLIISLEKDENKKGMMLENKILNEEEKNPLYENEQYVNSLIVKSMKDTDSKIDCLYFFKDARTINDILQDVEIQTDEQRIRIVESINVDSICEKFISQIEDENKRIALFSEIKNEFIRAELIKKLSSDRLKIQEMEKLENVYAQIEVACALEDDDEKIRRAYEFLSRTEYEEEVLPILTSVTSDEKKIEQFYKQKNDVSRGEILKSITDFELLMNHLDEIEDEFVKANVVIVIQDVEKRKECFSKLKTDRSKAIVLNSFSFEEDEFKKRCLSSMEDDFYKASVISLLSEEYEKEEGMFNLENDFAKLIIIDSFFDNYTKEWTTSTLCRLAQGYAAYLFGGDVGTDIDPEEYRNTLLREHKEPIACGGLPPEMTFGFEIESEGAMSEIILKKKRMSIFRR